MARPTAYTPELADEICRRLAAGESLNAICADPDMPGESTVRGWDDEDRDGFSAKYTRARARGYALMADEIIAISDNGNPGDNNRAKLRVDTRKWLLSKMLPKQFGDRTAVEHSGPDGGAIPTSITVAFVRPGAAPAPDAATGTMPTDRPDGPAGGG